MTSQMSSSGTHLWQNEGIEVSACRMNLLDIRGLLPQKVGENNGHSKDVSTGVPNFCKWHGCIASDVDFIHILGFS